MIQGGSQSVLGTDKAFNADPRVGVLFFILMAMLNVLIGICYKLIGSDLASGNTVVIRCLIVLVIIGLGGLITKNRSAILHPSLYILRGIASAAAWLCIVYAYATLPLALAQLIIFSEAFFVAPIAYVLMARIPRPAELGSIFIGILGICIVTLPIISLDAVRTNPIAMIVALVGAIAFALSLVFQNMITDRDKQADSLNIQITSNTVALSIFLVVSTIGVLPKLVSPIGEMHITFVNLPISIHLLLFVCAIAGLLAGVCMNKASKLCPMSSLAPGGLVALPVNYLIGTYIFQEELPELFHFGAILILIAFVLPVLHLNRGTETA